MRTPDGDVTGRAEPGFRDAATDEVVQFERVGFARVDAHRDEAAAEPDARSVTYFAHQ
jgi:glutamyl-tRNA synthetase